jgi:hypothetical protein
MLIRIFLVLLLVAVPAGAFERTADYAKARVGPWRVNVSSGWQADPRGRDAALQEVGRQLSVVLEVVPEPALAVLTEVPIWLENAPLHDGAGQFHRSGFWLRDNGYNPGKVGAVELNRRVVEWRQAMPLVVLHELAHAYHHRALLERTPEIEAAFAAAQASGVYGNAYAMTDPMEYFAELTEALFGQNDQTPRDRAELARIDPQGLALVAALWGVAP